MISMLNKEITQKRTKEMSTKAHKKSAAVPSKIAFVFLLMLSMCTFVINIHAQTGSFKPAPIDLKTDLSVRRSGPYFGIQKGKFDVIEVGMEGQYKKFKIGKPYTHAAHFGINYSFKNNILGYDVGYWFKKGRLNFTYGANLVLRTDFTHNKVGFAPVIGYKIWQFHIQTGYLFLTKTTVPMQTNTFFVSLRFVLINHNNFDLD